MLHAEVLSVIAKAFERGEFAEPKQGETVTIQSEEGSEEDAVALIQAHQRLVERDSRQKPRPSISL